MFPKKKFNLTRIHLMHVIFYRISRRISRVSGHQNRGQKIDLDLYEGHIISVDPYDDRITEEGFAELFGMSDSSDDEFYGF